MRSSRINVVIATTMAFGDIIIRDDDDDDDNADDDDDNDDDDWRLVPRRLRPVEAPGIIVLRCLSCLVISASKYGL